MRYGASDCATVPNLSLSPRFGGSFSTLRNNAITQTNCAREQTFKGSVTLTFSLSSPPSSWCKAQQQRNRSLILDPHLRSSIHRALRNSATAQQRQYQQRHRVGVSPRPRRAGAPSEQIIEESAQFGRSTQRHRAGAPRCAGAPPRNSVTPQQRHGAGAPPRRTDIAQERQRATALMRNSMSVTAQEHHRAGAPTRNSATAQQRMSVTEQEHHRAGAPPRRSDTAQERHRAGALLRNSATAQQRHSAGAPPRNSVTAQQRHCAAKIWRQRRFRANPLRVNEVVGRASTKTLFSCSKPQR
jgi:hypothetical protein